MAPSLKVCGGHILYICFTEGIISFVCIKGIRSHFKRAIEDVYSGLDTTVECFPRDNKTVDPLSYKEAIASFQPGDAVTIFTPDDTHFDIAMACIERGLHVLVTKPAVQSLDHHRQLFEAAEKKGVLVCIEVNRHFTIPCLFMNCYQSVPWLM
jgi:D-galacturonate reductase